MYVCKETIFQINVCNADTELMRNLGIMHTHVLYINNGIHTYIHTYIHDFFHRALQEVCRPSRRAEESQDTPIPALNCKSCMYVCMYVCKYRSSLHHHDVVSLWNRSTADIDENSEIDILIRRGFSREVCMYCMYVCALL